MKILIDENLPKRLKTDFHDHEIYTVSDKKWNGKKNGELLQLMIKEGFDVLLTFNKNLQYQQNFIKYPISVILIDASDNTYFTLKAFTPKILNLIKKGLKNGANIVK
ncbi:MAG: DUF5615 family PIN-like protein [Chitinophagales bacterium]